jgi:ABC-type Mn2+/Zn2+ transport system permease subunit
MPLGTELVDVLVEPWRSEITSRALLESVLIALAAGPLGCWVVLFGLSYAGESLAHAMLPGLVIAALAGFPLTLGAALGLAIAAPAIAFAGRLPTLGGDTSIAVVVTSLFGLGGLLALAPDTPAGLRELLFGNLLGVSDSELLLTAGLAAAIALALRAAHGRLLVVGFDRANAPAFGASPRGADALLLLLVGAFTLVAVQALGALLLLAMLVAPAATAHLVVQRLPTMMALAVAIAALAAVGGLYLSHYAGTAAGASIVVVVVAVHLGTAVSLRLAERLQPRPVPRLEPGG